MFAKRKSSAAGAPVNPAVASWWRNPKDLLLVRRLVWLYFWLLLLEGALRKWFLPQYSAPLLIVRDPIVILIYLLAAQQQLIPRGGFMTGVVVLSLGGVLLAAMQYLSSLAPAIVLLFGLRTNFLHLPLIFLLPEILDAGQVQKMGKWLLILALPMAALMAYQFAAPPDAWINRGVGLGSDTRQIITAMGKIRPPGTFSFITGAVSFFTLVAAFLGHGVIARPIYPLWLLLWGLSATVLGVAVSGSRTAVLSVGIVVVVFLLGLAMVRKTAAGLSRLLVLLVVVLFVLNYIQHFEEGVEVLETRFLEAGSTEREGGGLSDVLLIKLSAPSCCSNIFPCWAMGLGWAPMSAPS